MSKESMDPEADDFYDCLGADPGEPHPEFRKKISRFRAYYGSEYNEKISKIQKNLSDLDDRLEYNRQCDQYPNTLADIVLSLQTPDAVEVDEEASITVENADGDPVPDVTIAVDGAEAGTTDDEGQLTVPFDSGGAVTIEASKDDPNRTYTSPETTVEVVRERRTLHLTANVETVTVHRPVSFTVTDDHGNPVEDAVVEPIDGGDDTWSATTGSDGACERALEGVGDRTLYARKDDTEDIRYEDSGGVDLTVEPREISLELSADSHTAEVGEPVSFSVSDEDGTSISNVTLLYGDASVTTDSDGHADVPFEETGTVTVTADKSGPTAQYYSDEVDVSVKPRTWNLSVSAVPGSPAVGDPVSITVTDGDGSPVADATVTAGQQTVSTDDSGTYTLPPFSTPGDVTITAEKADTETDIYDDDTATISVTKASKNLRIQPSRDVVEAQTPFSISVTDADGNPVADARVKTPTETVTTGPSGTCTVSLSEVGPVDVTATKAETKTATYTPADTTIEVEPREIDLSIAIHSDPVEIGRPIDIHVTDSNGSPVEGVQVSGASVLDTVTTGPEGMCHPTITTTGQVTLFASKSDSDDRNTYSSDRRTVSVDRQERDLFLEVDGDDPVDTGSAAQLIVRDDLGQRVEGATVLAQGNSYTTDDRGVCRVTFSDASVTYVDVRRDSSRDWIDFTETRERIELDSDHRANGEPDGLPQWMFVSVLLVPITVVVATVLVLFNLVELLPTIATMAVAVSGILIWMIFQKL